MQLCSGNCDSISMLAFIHLLLSHISEKKKKLESLVKLKKL